MAKILIVDDMFIVSQDLAATLGRLGYQVAGLLHSAEDVLEAVQSLKPDVVLMDIRLKGEMDGIEVAGLLLKRHAGVSVVYLSGCSDEATLIRAASTNPCCYVSKPYDERKLHLAIESALEHKRKSDIPLSLEPRVRESGSVTSGSGRERN